MEIKDILKANEERKKWKPGYYPEPVELVAMREEGEKYLADRAESLIHAAPPPPNPYSRRELEPGVRTSPEHALIAKLTRARRLSAGTAELFGIEPHKFASQWGWVYPIPSGGARWKNANSDGAPKYAWPEGKPQDAEIYHAPDLLEGIAERGGVVWLTTEADVWTLRQAGIRNALATFGETIIPAGLGDMLVTMGVVRVLIAPDRDATGAAWSQRVKAALWGSTIELTCYELPAQLGEGGDIGRAWQTYSGAEPFEFWLTSLPQIAVEEPAPTHETPAPVYFTNGDPLAEIKRTITDALGVDRFGADGFSIRNVRCLFHDDQTPSASLGTEAGLWCHTCGRTYTWKELAAELGIPWPFKTTETVTALLVGIVGMSKEARQQFIAAGLTNLARVLDMLLDAGRGGEELTLAEIRRVCLPHVTASAVRQAFEQLRGKNMPKKRKGIICGIFSFLNTLQHKEGKKTLKYSSRGKPAAVAHIPTLLEIQHAAGAQAATYYDMMPETLASPTAYRAACLRDTVKRRPGKYARKQLAEPLGISAPTLKAYCDATGIERTPTPPKLTELTPDAITTLPADYRELRRLVKQKKIKPHVFLQDEHGRRRAYTQARARELLHHGGKLYRAEHQASDYRLEGSR